MAQDCALCLAPAGRSLVCAHCSRSLGAGVQDGHALSAFDYRFPLDRLVQRFKFAGDLAAGHWLALQLAARVRAEPRPDLLVAPPLTRARLRGRGFNQSVVVARVLAAELGIPHAHRGLRKVRETPPQQGLGRRARRANLRGAFRCDRALAGARVAIVDDVYTTGATVEALGNALREAGASAVVAWTLARAPSPGR